MTNNYVYANYLYHHGIRGMSWGKRNGPPYPLGFSAHSAKEKRLNPKSTIDGKPEESSKHKGLSKEAKTAIVITGAVVVAGITAYGVYKYKKVSGFNVSIIAKGKNMAKNRTMKSEQYWKDTHIYDHSTGRYVELRRKLKSNEYAKVVDRKEKTGKSISVVLGEMGFLK